MMKKILFGISTIIFVTTSILVIFHYYKKDHLVQKIIDSQSSYVVLPFSQWKKSNRLVDLDRTTSVVPASMNNFVFVNEESISKYVISEDEINHLYTIPFTIELNLNEHVDDFSIIIYEIVILEDLDAKKYIYGYNVTGQEITYAIDTWKTYCQFFIDERECELGSLHQNVTSTGLISITDKGIVTILEPRTDGFPFHKSAGVFETFGNSLGVYSHFTNMKPLGDDDDDDMNKFTYNFNSYLDDLFTYDFISVQDHIFNQPPYIHYSDWPNTIFLDFMLRHDLSNYKKIIIDALDKKEFQNSPFITFTLADLAKLTIEQCSQFKISIETCKKITRLWFYLCIIEKIPHNVNLIIVKKNIDLRRSKILSLARNRLM